MENSPKSKASQEVRNNEHGQKQEAINGFEIAQGRFQTFDIKSRISQSLNLIPDYVSKNNFNNYIT